jgi:hypothetical protein
MIKDKNPLLIVNYEHFKADDLVRFNGLLDKEPHADGTPLPTKTQIIGLMNRNKQECYQGSDFYSRFNRTEHCPLTDQQLEELKPTQAVEVAPPSSEDRIIINLYHAPDWEDRLLGRWVLNGDSLHFVEGELVKAIEEGKPIEIQNGFWGEQHFERFWQQILTKGIHHDGRLIQIPDHIKMVRPEADAYKWHKIPSIKEGLLIDTKAKILNPTSLVNFFGSYELVGDKLIEQKGFIEQAKNANQPLQINVTRTLTEDGWAILMDECHRLGVPLEIHCAAGVELPIAFRHDTTKPVSIEGIPQQITEDVFITSTDIDTTVALLTKANTKYVVIDVSECTPSDLLVKLEGKLNKETLKFEFSQSSGALKTALLDNKAVILKGQFSPELLDSLAPLLQSRKGTKDGGQIVLVSEDENAGAFISNHCTHKVSKEDKLDFLPPESIIRDKLASYLETEPLSTLQTRANFLKANPNATSSDEAWLGMTSLSNTTQASGALFDKSCSTVKSDEFTKERIAKVNEVLHYAPFVFLTGLSGVGKSTFVELELCSDKDSLFLTEERIQSWAEDTSNKRKILFIDEANLSSRQWSEFEGLFNTPPSVLVNGILHALTPNHKVVFAGNPVSYGDERALAPLFQRHGNTVLFTPLPPEVIYEKILKPVFTDKNMKLNPISDRILDVYRFICNCSTTEVLITPRELQMMALLTIARANKYPEQGMQSIAEHFSYELAKNLVPAAKQAEFDAQFKPKNSIKLPQSTGAKDFFLTPSRQVLSQQINDLLDLRQWRTDHAAELKPAQKKGGLGGLIIEGEPGIGKSELVMAELRARGYKEERDLENPTTKDKPFYKMSVSMVQDEKEKLLSKAFKEGAVVLIDEINSSPMMERLLNDLLMGKDPTGKKEDHVQPGFMVIGTQNPVTMAGRRVASTALQRRLISTTMPEYPADEIKTILLGKGVEAIEADAMIQSYEMNRSFALNNQLSPAPNFRNLMNLADEHLLSLQLPKDPFLQEIRKIVNDFTNKITEPINQAIVKHPEEKTQWEGARKLVRDLQWTANKPMSSAKEIMVWVKNNERQMDLAFNMPKRDFISSPFLYLFKKFKEAINFCCKKFKIEPPFSRTHTAATFNEFKVQYKENVKKEEIKPELDTKPPR